MKVEYRKPRTVLVNLALVAISTVVTILGADLVLRLFADKLLYYRPHEMFIERCPELPLVSRYKKNVDYSGETYGDLAAMIGDEHLREKRPIVFKTDSFGFRNSEEIRDHDAYDLIVLGDSFGVGNGTTQDRTWAALLQGHYGIKTYNLSIPGSPWQSYVHLATEIKRLPVHPKTIVLLALFSGNDLDERYYNADIEDLPWSSTGKTLLVRISTFVRRSPIRQCVRRLRHRSVEHVLVKDFVDGRKILFYPPYVNAKNRSEAMTLDHPNYDKLLHVIREIDRVAGDHHATLVILLLPSKEEVYEWVVEGYPPWTASAKPSGLGAALDNFCRQNNLSFFDLKPSLMEAAKKEFEESGGLIYWTDDTHWNEKGHGIVASIVYRATFMSSSRAPDKGMHTDRGSAALNPRR